jgi:hypothetical protein
MHALRRTPPSATTPYADRPPVLRVLYAYCRRPSGELVAVVLIGGDKTDLGNRWYPPTFWKQNADFSSTPVNTV